LKKLEFILITVIIILSVFLICYSLRSYCPIKIFVFAEKNKIAHSGHSLRGGTFRWGTANSPTIINPILTTHSVASPLMELIFDPLVHVNEKGEITPGLANSWEISENKLEYTFHINKGVKFHDGRELTAQDVKFTYDAIKNPKNNSAWRANLDIIDRWEILNNYTIKMVLKEPFPLILYKLVREIAPKHLLDKFGNLAENTFNYFPIGTGPYKFKDWDKERQQIILDANNEYFEGRPYIDRIVVNTYPDNEKLWSAFMRQEIEMVQFISMDNYKVIENDMSFKGFFIPVGNYYAIVYNTNDYILSDYVVREAVALSIDRQALIDQILGGAGIESIGPFHPDSELFNKNVVPIEYNPTKASLNLSHRGWEDKNNDGILEKGGKNLEINLLIDSKSSDYIKIATLLRQQLAEVGIKVNVILYDDLSELSDNYLKTTNANAALKFIIGKGFGSYGGYEPAMYWSSLSSEFGRIWGYENSYVDSLIEKSQKAINKNEYLTTYHEIHKALYADQPVCFLFYPGTFHAVSSDIKDIDNIFNFYMPMYNLKKCYISRSSS